MSSINLNEFAGIDASKLATVTKNTFFGEKILIAKAITESIIRDVITVTVVAKAEEHPNITGSSIIIVNVSVQYGVGITNCAKLSTRYYSPLSIDKIDENNIDANSLELFEQIVENANKMAQQFRDLQIPEQITTFINDYCIINSQLDNELTELVLCIYRNWVLS